MLNMETNDHEEPECVSVQASDYHKDTFEQVVLFSGGYKVNAKSYFYLLESQYSEFTKTCRRRSKSIL